MAKTPGEVLRHPMRIRILAACTERETSIRDFVERHGVPRSKAKYHFDILLEENYIRICRKEDARGGKRHIYVATRLGVITDAEFAELGVEEQRRTSVAVVTTFHERCRVAIEADTFDSRDDSHFTWNNRVLDEQGWKELMAEDLRTYERSNQIEAESRARLKRDGGKAVFTTTAIAGFESPAEKLPELLAPLAD